MERNGITWSPIGKNIPFSLGDTDNYSELISTVDVRQKAGVFIFGLR